MEAGKGIVRVREVAHQRGDLVAVQHISGLDRRPAGRGDGEALEQRLGGNGPRTLGPLPPRRCSSASRSEEHTSELQSQSNLVCRLLLEKKKKMNKNHV